MKRNLISLLGTALVLFGSCSHEAPMDGGPVYRGEGRMTIEVEGLVGPNGVQTRAPGSSTAEAGENLIGNLYLLFFDQTTHVFDSYAQVPGIPREPVPNPDPNATPDDGSVLMNVDGIPYPQGQANKAWDILAIANIDEDYFVDGSVAGWMAQWAGKTEEFVTSNALATLPTAIGSNRILMSGRIEKPENENQIHLVLTRNVARLDVKMGDVVVNEGYRLMSATVWNAFPTTSVWEQSGVDANAQRVKRYGGVTLTEEAGGGWPTAIRGGLYAFENRVAALTEATYNDRLTTNLIIGLQKGTDPILYYRANVKNENGAQNLVRNHVYTISITKVLPGTGKTTEEEAYLGESNGLSYFIGDWNEQTNGLIVSDEYSSLSIPTKTAILGSGKELNYDEKVTAEFRIHTFSTLADPAPLRIRSQSYTPAVTVKGDPSIEAHLDGNLLVIEARKLDPDNTPRRGVIVLSYAGLEIAMSVSQAGKNDYFLNVTEPDGGILPFAAYGGIPSGLINVQASGHWTARLHMSGFSFDSQLGEELATRLIWTNPASPGDPEYTYTDGRGYNTSLNLITPDANDSTLDKFRVWTNSHNMGSDVRRSFVVVSLDGVDGDGKPLADTYSAIIQLSQNYVRSLHYTYSTNDPTNLAPEDWLTGGGTTTFDGTGSLATGSGYDKNTGWWYVNPGRQDNRFIAWQAIMQPDGTTDDREFFEIVRDLNDVTATAYDPSDARGNRVKIRAKGMNTSGRDYRVKLRVQTDQSTFADISVIQRSTSFEFRPGIIMKPIPSGGGETEKISVVLNSTAELFWRVTNIEQTQVMAPDGRQLVHNGPITVKVYNADGTFVKNATIGEEYPLDYKFSIKMSKIYFPNRDISVGANVTVAVAGHGQTEGMSKTISASQLPLEKRHALIHYNSKDGYANLDGDSYNGGMKKMLKEIGGGFSYNEGPYTGGTTILHRNNDDDACDWYNTKDFIDKRDGVFILVADYDAAARIRDINELGHGWEFKGNGDGPYDKNTGANTKLMVFLNSKIASHSWDYREVHDGASTRAIALPPTATSLLNRQTDGRHSVFAIDPKHRIVFIGESQAVGTEYTGIMDKLKFYMAYTSKYGSAFSNMLIDRPEDGGVAAPWDDVWGANKVELFKNIDM